MKVRLLLATAAEVRDSLLFVLGGGWSEIGPEAQPIAIAGIIEVTWEETNRRRRLEFIIEDEDGQPLNVPTPTGDQPFRINADFDIGRPPGVIAGRSFNLPIALPLGPTLRPASSTSTG